MRPGISAGCPTHARRASGSRALCSRSRTPKTRGAKSWRRSTALPVPLTTRARVAVRRRGQQRIASRIPWPRGARAPRTGRASTFTTRDWLELSRFAVGTAEHRDRDERERESRECASHVSALGSARGATDERSRGPSCERGRVAREDGWLGSRALPRAPARQGGQLFESSTPHAAHSPFFFEPLCIWSISFRCSLKNFRFSALTFISFATESGRAP